MRKATKEEIDIIIDSFENIYDKESAKENKYFLIAKHIDNKIWGEIKNTFNHHICNNEYIDMFGSTNDGFVYAVVKDKKVKG